LKQLGQLIAETHGAVKVHVGCGPVALDGFLNIDIQRRRGCKHIIWMDATQPWDCPSECVDYIFSEDFIEHLDQHAQIRFLAETFRVMKPGAVQHVSTPRLEWVMNEKSRFAAGAAGVYDEWGRWGHKLVHTVESLRSMAELVGFEVSPSAKLDPIATRPGKDRDQLMGNIFVDLVKP